MKEQNVYYAQLNSEGNIVGFYLKGLHGEDVCNRIYTNGGIKINEELWNKLLSYGVSKFKSIKEDRVYIIDDLALFEKYIPPIDNTPHEPAIGDRIVALELALLEIL